MAWEQRLVFVGCSSSETDTKITSASSFLIERDGHDTEDKVEKRIKALKKLKSISIQINNADEVSVPVVGVNYPTKITISVYGVEQTLLYKDVLVYVGEPSAA